MTEETPISILRVFSGSKTLGDVAENLHVDVKALWCVEIKKNETCAMQNCPYPAVENNDVHGAAGGNYPGNRCCVHASRWFPTGNKRGNYLLGHLYFRSDSQKMVCSCGSKACIGIGYSPHLVNVPRDAKIRGQIIGDLQTIEDSEKIMDLSRPCRLAVWHFDEKYREIDPTTGHWRLKDCYEYVKNKTKTYRDNEGKVHIGLPPANHSLDAFVLSEIASLHRIQPKERWQAVAHDSLYPHWLDDYIAAEGGRNDNEKHTSPDTTHGSLTSPSIKVQAADAASKEVTNALLGRSLTANFDKEKMLKDLQSALKAAKEALLERDATIVGLEEAKRQLNGRVNELEAKVDELEQELAEVRKLLCKLANDRFLSFEDLAEGGRLADSVKTFTLFRTYKANYWFLETLNWDDEEAEGGCAEGDDLKRVHTDETDIEIGKRVLQEDIVSDLKRKHKEFINGK